MIALDTNVLVRFLTQDHPAQSRAATEAIASLTSDRPGLCLP
jgi:predicted nucleic-acid-binding protein